MDHHNENQPEFNELSMLFSMIDERNAALDKQMREQIENRRSIQRTLEQQEAERLRDVNSLGSWDAAHAVRRENIRKSAAEKDAAKRKRAIDKTFEDIY